MALPNYDTQNRVDKARNMVWVWPESEPYRVQFSNSRGEPMGGTSFTFDIRI
jgi:hypothetical protein